MFIFIIFLLINILFSNLSTPHLFDLKAFNPLLLRKHEFFVRFNVSNLEIFFEGFRRERLSYRSEIRRGMIKTIKTMVNTL